MDHQRPHQKVTVLVEDLDTGLITKAIFHKTTDLIMHRAPVAEGYSTAEDVTMTLRVFPSEKIELFRIEQPKETAFRVSREELDYTPPSDFDWYRRR